MRLHNFFIPQTIGDQQRITIDDSGLINQWRHVLRFNTGSTVLLFDNSGFEYLAQFMELTYLKAVFIILEKRKNKFLPKKEIFLFQALIKNDKFEWILEKGTELGVAHFIPVLAKQSVAKKVNFVRAEKILKESSEQSGRGILPTISKVVSLEEALDFLSTPAFVFDPSGSPFHNSRLRSETTDGQALFTIHNSASVFIGPEGGWNEQELEMMRNKKIPIFSLGSQVLRAETAAVAVSALILL